MAPPTPPQTTAVADRQLKAAAAKGNHDDGDDETGETEPAMARRELIERVVSSETAFTDSVARRVVVFCAEHMPDTIHCKDGVGCW